MCCGGSKSTLQQFWADEATKSKAFYSFGEKMWEFITITHVEGSQICWHHEAEDRLRPKLITTWKKTGYGATLASYKTFCKYRTIERTHQVKWLPPI